LSIVRFISDRIVVIYKGRIMEIAETEELFKYPLHPYTHSLMSAIPIPDPILEKKKKLFIYTPHEYGENDRPTLTDIGNGHMVYGSAAEIEEYRRVRFG
ncbi:MAG: peptide ABC transporter ATP-binding protein, partial [Clostridia bacterium]|nr:peptide ABC transporter ATP-binding protein [Clostridia bacterium]